MSCRKTATTLEGRVSWSRALSLGLWFPGQPGVKSLGACRPFSAQPEVIGQIAAQIDSVHLPRLQDRQHHRQQTPARSRTAPVEILTPQRARSNRSLRSIVVHRDLGIVDKQRQAHSNAFKLSKILRRRMGSFSSVNSASHCPLNIAISLTRASWACWIAPPQPSARDPSVQRGPAAWAPAGPAPAPSAGH